MTTKTQNVDRHSIVTELNKFLTEFSAKFKTYGTSSSIALDIPKSEGIECAINAFAISLLRGNGYHLAYVEQYDHKTTLVFHPDS